MNFEKPITVTLSGNFESGDDLYLYDTTEGEWTSASQTCTGSDMHLSVSNGVLTVNICHLTQFAVFQPTSTPTSGAAITQSSSKSSNTTTIIIAVVVPVGVVILLAIAIVVYRVTKNSERKRVYGM